MLSSLMHVVLYDKQGIHWHPAKKITRLNFSVWLSSAVPIFVLLSERHEWPAAPIAACLHRGPGGCFHSETCIGGESMEAPRANCSRASTHQHRARY